MTKAEIKTDKGVLRRKRFETAGLEGKAQMKASAIYPWVTESRSRGLCPGTSDLSRVYSFEALWDLWFSRTERENVLPEES
jgi:hypothetical protein